MQRIPNRRPTPIRDGLTLVEVMLALVLVAVGLLGIAGSTALMFRAVTSQTASLRATRQGALRVAQLSAAGCAGARSGRADDARTGLAERWWLGPVVNGAQTIDDTLTWNNRGAPAVLIVRSALLC